MINVKKLFSKPLLNYIVISLGLLLLALALLINVGSNAESAKAVDAISVQIYLIATLISIVKFVQLTLNRRGWLPTLILLVVVLSFLEESEWFREIRYLSEYFHIRFNLGFMTPYFVSLETNVLHSHSLHSMVDKRVLPWINANTFTALFNAFLNGFFQVAALSSLLICSDKSKAD